MRGKTDALTDACGCVTVSDNFRKVPERCAADFEKSFEGVWGCCAIKREVAPNRGYGFAACFSYLGNAMMP